jgi:hypothetical protein
MERGLSRERGKEIKECWKTRNTFHHAIINGIRNVDEDEEYGPLNLFCVTCHKKFHRDEIF